MRGWTVAAAPLLALMLVAQAVGADAALQIAAEPAGTPWWQRATWQPRATVVRGIAVKRLHPEWCAAEAFSREAVARDLLTPTGGALPAGLEFAVERSFDGSGRMQVAFVGAYRRCAGEAGLYLAIVEPQRERPRVRFIVEVPNAGAFAALGQDPDGTLVAWWCAECDQGVRIAWNRESRAFYVGGPASQRR